jgi:hypothetical protein
MSHLLRSGSPVALMAGAPRWSENEHGAEMTSLLDSIGAKTIRAAVHPLYAVKEESIFTALLMGISQNTLPKEDIVAMGLNSTED